MITSLSNEKVKAWRKLHKRKGRKESRSFLVEGMHLIEEAWKSKQPIIEIIVEENRAIPDWCGDFQVERVSKQVFAYISQTTTPQGIAAVIGNQPKKRMTGKYMILIDGVQDPGNLGTIIRTADAAGMDAVVLGKGTVDLYNDKAVRATQGSLFHIPIYEADLLEEMNRLQEESYEIWATTLEDAMYYHEVEIPEKVALILGNEGSGIQQNLIEKADRKIKIPIYGQAESLNVSVAAGILMYHLRK